MEPFCLSRSEVRELDRRSIEGFGIPGVVLMENAGRGCAELLRKLNPEKYPTAILCGPGNNGGDGFVMARHLDNHDYPVGLYLLSNPDQLNGDAALNYSMVSRIPSIPVVVNTGPHAFAFFETIAKRCLHSRMWIVDAMFGTGLSRGLAAPYAEVASAANESGASILAVDIPSGLDCDTGEPLGPTIRANHTATFVARKQGFLNPTSHQWTGEIHVIDIGAPRILIDEYRQRRLDNQTASIGGKE